jgi:hypothetical protein
MEKGALHKCFHAYTGPLSIAALLFLWGGALALRLTFRADSAPTQPLKHGGDHDDARRRSRGQPERCRRAR